MAGVQQHADLAHPLLNPMQNFAGNGPLLLAVDNGWAAAPHWQERQAAMEEWIERADRQGLPVQILATAPGGDGKPVQLTGTMAGSGGIIVLDDSVGIVGATLNVEAHGSRGRTAASEVGAALSRIT